MRREFIVLVGATLTAAPFAALAQQSARMPRIGVITGTAEADPQIKSWIAGFTRGLGELGWHPGRNVALDFRWGDGNMARIRNHATEFAQQPPDIVFSIGTASTGATKQAGGSGRWCLQS
jgi:putative ABC transport system substrate-binding protein